MHLYGVPKKLLSLDLINDGLTRSFNCRVYFFSTLIMTIPFPFKLYGEQWLLFNRCCSWNHIKSIQKHSIECFFGSFVSDLSIARDCCCFIHQVNTTHHIFYCHRIAITYTVDIVMIISAFSFLLRTFRCNRIVIIIISIENGISSAHCAHTLHSSYIQFDEVANNGHHNAKQWHGYWHKWMHSAFIYRWVFFKVARVCMIFLPAVTWSIITRMDLW